MGSTWSIVRGFNHDVRLWLATLSMLAMAWALRNDVREVRLIG